MSKELKDILEDIIILIAQVSAGYDDKYINEQATELFEKVSKMEVNNNE